MMFFIGVAWIFLCVLGSFVMEHGKLSVLCQPFELLIIFGSAIGALIIANPMSNIKKILNYLGRVVSGSHYSREEYIDLLHMMYEFFKLDKQKGTLQLEPHVENPDSSSIFTKYPKFLSNKVALPFFCDTIRTITMGITNPHQIEDMMETELETFGKETGDIYSAVETMADGLPALGIVAAVLGVIKTMGAINEPPDILGGMIGSALVGTFLGVLLAYGFIAPIANFMKKIAHDDKRFLECMKVGIIAHLNGCAPAVSVEFARKNIFLNIRPTFTELDAVINNVG